MLTVEPMSCEASVEVDGPGLTGELTRARIERWSTNMLGCEVWRTVTRGRVGWHRDLGTAVEIAARAFTVAGYGHPPAPPAMLASRRLWPTGWITADRITPTGATS